MFSFPNPVNEKAARVVAGVVALTGVVILLTGWHWLLVLLAYGFWARVLTGPTFSPLGRLAMRVVAPRLGAPRYVAGPPKRFAQGIGAALTSVAAALALGLGLDTAADVLTGLLVVAATLESVFALCLGCRIFTVLMRAGSFPRRRASAARTSGRSRPPRSPEPARPVGTMDGDTSWGRQASTWSIRRDGREPRFRAAS